MQFSRIAATLFVADKTTCYARANQRARALKKIITPSDIKNLVCQPKIRIRRSDNLRKLKHNDDVGSLSHTKWNCQYHIVFTPIYRRKAIGRLKKPPNGGRQYLAL